MRFVDVTNDIAFRRIFGNENRKEALISFLNAVLALEEAERILDVEFMNPYQLPDLLSGKVIILDVKARDQQGRNYIVEMQVGETDGFNKRVLYYASKSYSSQIERGEQYRQLRPVFFIGILNFEITQNPCYISRHRVMDVQTGEHLIQDVAFNFIELPKFQKQETELKTIIDQWVFFIKNSETLKEIPEAVQDQGLINAYEDADKYNWTRDQLLSYDYASMLVQDARGRVEFAVRKGIEKGLEEAREQVEEAQEKVQEAQEKVQEAQEKAQEAKKEVVKNLYAAGVSIEVIAQGTGFSIDEVRLLVENLQL